MENSYESGFAFVLEGATERVFYERLLYFFARKHPNCYDKSFNRFLIISLDVLICRYSPLFRAFPALFI